MKVVFKVCCAPENDLQNVTSSGNGHHHNSNVNTNNQVHHENGGKINHSSGNRGTSINTNLDKQNADGTSGRVPPLLINTSNNYTGNVVQSTMSWPSWSGNNGDSFGGGSYLHSTPLTSTLSAQQYYPHQTSPRPNVNSPVNNNSNFAPSHKPTKKTSKSFSLFFPSST